MTFVRQRREGTSRIICDVCGDAHEVDTLDFDEALEDFRLAGGRPALEQGQWEHHCKSCN